MLENSLFGLPQGSAFITKGHKYVPSSSSDFKNKVIHLLYSMVIKEASGIEMKFINHLDMIISLMQVIMTSSPEDMAEYGLMDKPFFEQSIPY